MKEEIRKIKKIIKENPEKRILILGTRISGKKELMNELKIDDFASLYDQKLTLQFGYIDLRYITEEEKEKVKKSIQIKPGIPMFSEEIIESDLILFLNLNENLLKLKAYLEQVSFYNILNTQNQIKKALKSVKAPIKTINVKPHTIDLKKEKRIVYLCGKLDNINFTDKRQQEFKDRIENEFACQFPYIKKVNNLDELKRKQGFLAIINENFLPQNSIELDKKYRSFFKNFTYVYIITEDVKKQNKYHLKYSPFYYVNENYFEDETLYRLFLNNLLTNKLRKISVQRREKLEELKKYLKGKETFTTKELKKVFLQSERQIERDLEDFNNLYGNIGYDFKKKEWYQVNTIIK